MAGNSLQLKGTPNPRQEEFFLAKAPHIAYGGARGGGKSWAMRRKFILLCLNYPNLKCLLMRRTFPELESNHIIPLRRELNGIANYVATRKVFEFPNGSFIKLGYCDTEMDVDQYQGQEYDVIGLEEATHFTDAQRVFIATCNRNTRDDFAPRMYYTCNPGGVGHAWVKRLFIDKEYLPNENPDDYLFIPAKVWDNTVLMESNPQYVQNLRNLPEDMRRAHLDGDWDVLAGQFFKEWRRSKHVCEPFAIPHHWRKFRSMDWGYNDPCCVLWFAISPDNRVYVYDEYYQNQTRATDVSREVIRKTGFASISYTVGSPDMWQKRGAILRSEGGFTGENIAEVFYTSGVPITPADNSRMVGWQRIREYLADAPDGIPYLQVFDTCTNLIKSMPIMQRDRNDPEDVAGGLEDHAPEALRYGLMSRPRSNKEVIPTSNNKKVVRFNPLADPKETRQGFLSVGGRTCRTR